MNLSDVGIIVNRLLGRDAFSGTLLSRTDANGDGRVDIADVVWVLRRRSMLNLTMSVDADPVQAGQLVLVTLATSNNTTQTLTDVTTHFVIPGYSDFGSFGPGETYSVNHGTLAIGQTATVVIPLRMRTGGSAAPHGALLDFQAYVTSTEGSRADVLRRISAHSERPLLIGLATDESPFIHGRRVRYTVLYGNKGVTSLPDAVVRFPVPFGLLDPEVDEGGTVDSGSVTWSFGTLAPGQTGHLHLYGTVDSQLNEGELIIAAAELLAGGQSALVELATPVTAASPLAFDISTDDDPVAPDQLLGLRLTVANRRTEPMSGVVMSFIMPEYADVGSINPGETMTINVGALAPGQSYTELVPVRIRTGSSGPPDGYVLRIVGSARSDQGHYATVRRDVTAAGQSALEIGITTDQNPAQAGEPIVYNVQYGNRGGEFVLDGELLMPIPEGLIDVDAEAGGIIEDGWVRWSLGSLAPGRGGVVRLRGRIDELAAGSTIRAEARLRAGSRSAYSAIVTPVKPRQPLVFEIFPNANPVAPAQNIQLTLVVTNRGDQTLNGVEHALILSDYVDSGNVRPGQSIKTTIGTLQPGESQARVIPIRVRTGSSGPPDGGILHFNGWAASVEGYRSDLSRDLMVRVAPVLNVAIETDRDPVVPGGEVEYVSRYGNHGNTTGPAATLRLELPESLEEPSAENSGTINEGWAHWNLGALSPGEVGLVRLRARVAGGLEAGSLIRTHALLQAGGDAARAWIATPARSGDPVVFDVTFSAEPLHPGQAPQIIWTVTNRGDQPVTGIQVETLMGEFLDIGSTGPGESLTSTGFDLAPGQSWSDVLRPAVRTGSSGPASGRLTNLRFALRSAQGQHAALARSFVFHADNALDLGIATDTDPAVAGGELVYTLHYGNYGGATPADATLRLMLPDGVEVLQSDGGGAEGRWIAWPVGPLGAGESGQKSVTVRVGDDLTDGDQLRAVTEVRSGDRWAHSTIATPVRRERPSLQGAAAFDTDPVLPGQEVYFGVSAGVIGDQDAYDIRMETTVSDYADSGSTRPGGVVQQSRAALSAGQAHVWRVPYTIRTGSSGPPPGNILHTTTRLTTARGEQVVLRRNVAVKSPSGLDVGLAAGDSPLVQGSQVLLAVHYGNPTGQAIDPVELRLHDRHRGHCRPGHAVAAQGFDPRRRAASAHAAGQPRRRRRQPAARAVHSRPGGAHAR